VNLVNSDLKIFYLLFADDTLILCDAMPKQLRYLWCILLCNEAVSGLKINLRKSEIVPVGEVRHLEELASFLGVMCLFYR
jgi:hypothetical protein